MKVIIAAAGTAGHINPGIAIANKIKAEEKNSEIIFIGTTRGLENDLVPRAGYKLKTIDAYGLSKKISIDNIKKLYKTFKGLGEAKKIIKEIKPDILGRYIFFHKVVRIEMKRPIGSDDVQREYLHSQLNSQKYFFDQNLDFYQYYRSRATHLDTYYFVRYKSNFRLCLDCNFLDKDPAFSTGFDYKVAKILSNEMLRIYLNRQLQLLDRKTQIAEIRTSLSDFSLKWTGSKSEAIEWGYGLFAAKSLNYGNATIKEIMVFIEAAFGIELGDYYRTYLSLKNRKKDRTAFFTFIVEQLQKRMDDDNL